MSGGDVPAGYLSDVNVNARMMWRWATANATSTGATTNILPAMMTCQRSPVPS